MFCKDPARDLTGEEHGDDFLIVESMLWCVDSRFNKRFLRAASHCQISKNSKNISLNGRCGQTKLDKRLSMHERHVRSVPEKSRPGMVCVRATDVQLQQLEENVWTRAATETFVPRWTRSVHERSGTPRIIRIVRCDANMLRTRTSER